MNTPGQQSHLLLSCLTSSFLDDAGLNGTLSFPVCRRLLASLINNFAVLTALFVLFDLMACLCMILAVFLTRAMVVPSETVENACVYVVWLVTKVDSDVFTWREYAGRPDEWYGNIAMCMGSINTYIQKIITSKAV